MVCSDGSISLGEYPATHLLQIVTTELLTPKELILYCARCSVDMYLRRSTALRNFNFANIAQIFHHEFYNERNRYIEFTERTQVMSEKSHTIYVAVSKSPKLHDNKELKNLYREIFNTTALNWKIKLKMFDHSERIEKCLPDKLRNHYTKELNDVCLVAEPVMEIVENEMTPELVYYPNSVIGKTVVKFMTCTNRQNDNLSFDGFISAFDTSTWICMLLGKLFINHNDRLKCCLFQSFLRTGNLSIILLLVSVLLSGGGSVRLHRKIPA